MKYYLKLFIIILSLLVLIIGSTAVIVNIISNGIIQIIDFAVLISVGATLCIYLTERND